MLMRKLSVVVFLFSVAAFSVSAQTKLRPKPVYVEWADKPEVHPVLPEYKNEPAYFITNDQFLDYRYEGNSINEYYTLHRIIKILDDKGIETFNKIFFSVNRGTRIPSIKARTIMPDGRVYDITKEMIKVSKDEHGRNKILFAMEGLVKDAEVEILIKEIRPADMFGNATFQYGIPVVNTRFEMSYPKDMIFEEKGFNGFPDGRDTLAGNRRHLKIAIADIPALRPEKRSYPDRYAMRCEYRIVNFLDPYDNNRRKIYTWEDLSRKMFNDYCKYSEKERKAVNKYLSELGVMTNGDEYENIKKIENGIKSSIVLFPYMDEFGGEALDSIITHKSATAYSVIRLYNACFTQAGINHELGVTSDRSEHSFDYKFENWDNMDNHLFYFPNLDRFMSPTNVYCRYPFVPEDVLTTTGIFCLIPANGITIGQLAEVKRIAPLPANKTQDNVTASVTFSADMDAQVDVDYSWSGYSAIDVREGLSFERKSDIRELLTRFIPLCEKPEDLVKYNITNLGFDNSYGNKPVGISATVNAPQLTESAGPNYLFKLGDVIGAQDEMYDTKKDRKYPLDIPYPYSMNHTITVYLPKGYKILNPDAIKMDIDYVDSKMKPVVSFKSDFVLKTDRKNKNGDTLIVTVKGLYTKSHYTVTEFNEYKKVLNAAADFNKVSLLISNKKGMAAAGKHPASGKKKQKAG
jgi:uncharacterized protein DUF3857